MDGWVSLEVSPLLARDTSATVAAARELFARANPPNLFINIRGTTEGLPVATNVPDRLRNRLGIAIAKRTYKAANALLSSNQWRRTYNFGARPQRVLWASTGSKGPNASPVLYVNALRGIDREHHAGRHVDEAFATQLQDEGAEAFVRSWKDLLQAISSRSASIGKSIPSTAA